MKFTPTRLPDVVICEPNVFGDDRGWFMESFNEKRFHDGLKALGLRTPRAFVQDNHSRSQRGVLRGVHYQLPPHPQGKLVRVTKGSAYDVAVDIRKDSPTFGQWVGVTLTATNHQQLWVPEGFAHGFIALEDDTHFLYKTTDYYAKDCERAILWNDPTLAIEWPLLHGMTPSLAPKDAAASSFATADVFKTTP
jgi:dTDP-4-dehydrorhamnose 3,5-epimerase